MSTQRYLVGDTLTEADVRLAPTLFRFDTAYHGLFKVFVPKSVLTFRFSNRVNIHVYVAQKGFIAMFVGNWLLITIRRNY